MKHRVKRGDCLELMKAMPDNSVDLVVTSPPYANARAYDIDFDLKGHQWVDWAEERFVECLRVSKGLVAWVVEGTGQQTVNYTSEPILLHAQLIQNDIPMWKPSIYGRFSLPGKFAVLRNNFEFILMSSNGQKLEFSDPAACGSAPVCAPGGRTRPRKRDGSRNQAEKAYKQPKKTNHGNIIWCSAVGGGNMGSPLATENEAPFPERVPEVLIKSFCKPGGTVLDPFAGSGTTLAVAKKYGRNSIGFDIRKNQVELARKRLQETTPIR